MMFLELTNAVNNEVVIINPSNIGNIQGRSDEKYPRTRAVIILNDKRETFIPVIEEMKDIRRMLSGATSGVANNRTAVQDTRDVPDNTNER